MDVLQNANMVYVEKFAHLSSADSVPESTCSSRPCLSSACHSAPSAPRPSTHTQKHTQYIFVFCLQTRSLTRNVTLKGCLKQVLPIWTKEDKTLDNDTHKKRTKQHRVHTHSSVATSLAHYSTSCAHLPSGKTAP